MRNVTEYSISHISLYIQVGGGFYPPAFVSAGAGLGLATKRKHDGQPKGGETNRRPETEPGNTVAGHDGEGARNVIEVGRNRLCLRRHGQRNGSSQGHDGEQFLFVHFFVAAPSSVIATVMPNTFVADFVCNCNYKLKNIQ